MISGAASSFEVGPESLFLAHIFALQDFVDNNMIFVEYDPDEGTRLVQQDIPPIRAFLREDTHIGAYLDGVLQRFEQRVFVQNITMLANASLQGTDSPSHLTLVPNPSV